MAEKFSAMTRAASLPEGNISPYNMSIKVTKSLGLR